MQKARQFELRFYSQKSGHFMLRDFSLLILHWHLYIYKKHETLRYMTFYIQKDRHLEKARQVALKCFIYKNPDTLCYAIFHVMFEIGEGRGHFYTVRLKWIATICSRYTTTSSL